ncbi:unnamed protein product [Menidia menidia]|uniref:(Atlantic silverside) hypothetical protein n=1 Tax=Menidia menidia TaxID=238744 RepID=A0A8S4B4U6_9TELE|nr:unnamed protein product [Menidia menidia]
MELRLSSDCVAARFLLLILVTLSSSQVPSPLHSQRNAGGGGNVPRGHRTPLPGIFLSNVRSLSNKIDELQLLMGKRRDCATSAVLCFTETWLCGSIPDSALQLAGFQLFRADRNTELSGKTKGGGICFYTNSGWCNAVTVIQQHCSPDLETFFINCKPLYSPREFASFILVGVYITPQANVQDAQRTLADQILRVERTYPDSLVIVLGDFNKGNVTHELPKYRQLIKCPTREDNILDHCYTTISNAYHAVPRTALGHSDHVMVHLIPAYRQKLKLCKPAVRTSKQWSSEAVEDLQACLETTDWDVFRTATTSLDEYTGTVTSYISFCEDCCIQSRTRVSYNNDKPWFSPKIRQLRLQKEEAFRSGDRDRFKESKYRFSKAVRDAKRLYSENLKKQFSANDSASVWKGLRQITNYKPKPPHSVNDLRLANELNDFYCRFERQWDSPNTNTIPRHHQPLPSCSPTPTSAGACPHPQLPTLKDPLPVLHNSQRRSFKTPKEAMTFIHNLVPKCESGPEDGHSVIFSATSLEVQGWSCASQTLEVRLGEDVTLMCSNISESLAFIDWFRVTKGAQPSSLHDGQSVTELEITASDLNYSALNFQAEANRRSRPALRRQPDPHVVSGLSRRLSQEESRVVRCGWALLEAESQFLQNSTQNVLMISSSVKDHGLSAEDATITNLYLV